MYSVYYLSDITTNKFLFEKNSFSGTQFEIHKGKNDGHHFKIDSNNNH